MLDPSKRLILLGIHQRLEVLDALLVDLDLGDPAAAVGVVLGDLVDGAGLLLECEVDGGDGAGDGGVDVGGALDGLDGADGVARAHLFAFRGELNVHDVAELLGGVLRDPDHAGGLVGVQVDPFVVFGVFADVSCGVESTVSIWICFERGGVLVYTWNCEG